MRTKNHVHQDSDIELELNAGGMQKVTIVNLGTSKTNQTGGALKLYSCLKTMGKASLDGGGNFGLSPRPCGAR
jgi:hypothetical protein